MAIYQIPKCKIHNIHLENRTIRIKLKEGKYILGVQRYYCKKCKKYIFNGKPYSREEIVADYYSSTKKMTKTKKSVIIASLVWILTITAVKLSMENVIHLTNSQEDILLATQGIIFFSLSICFLGYVIKKI